MTGFYPSPAGATECRLDLQAWAALARPIRCSTRPSPTSRPSLICRTGDAGVEHFIVPIDACYELAGRMRLYWRGFDGGTEARASIADFLGASDPRQRSVSQERLTWQNSSSTASVRRPDKYAVIPSMSLKLRISETTGQRVDAIALRCQIRIEPARRRYTDGRGRAAQRPVR